MKNSDVQVETPWIDEAQFTKLLCGLETKAPKLFPSSDYEDVKLLLDAEDEKIAEMLSKLSEDDAALLLIMKKIFDWSILSDIIGDGNNISESKVKIYETHKADLKKLKNLVKKYLPPQDYQELFCQKKSRNNYVAYIGNAEKVKEKEEKKESVRDKFYKALTGKLNAMSIEDDADKDIRKDILGNIATAEFLPKQVVSDNRIIPYQLYWNELNHLLTKASGYFPFLNECDEDGLSVKEKILSIMEFRVPYFVGPLNSYRKFAWIKRKAEGRILPWNFEQKVDLDACEEQFIKRMTNRCTYLPSEQVLPKHSLLYQRFEVLNLINTIHVNGEKIKVEVKQQLFNLFCKSNTVKKTNILKYLTAYNYSLIEKLANICSLS